MDFIKLIKINNYYFLLDENKHINYDCSIKKYLKHRRQKRAIAKN